LPLLYEGGEFGPHHLLYLGTLDNVNIRKELTGM
jgi:hypothetical protein